MDKINNFEKVTPIKKTGILKFLYNNKLDILWAIPGEKYSLTGERDEKSYFKVPCGVFYLDNGKLEGELKMYDRD